MTDREKIIELLDEVHHKPLGKEYLERLGTIADYLIANGMTVQEWIPVSQPPKPDNELDARNWYLVALKNGVVKELAYEFREDSIFGFGWRETAYPVTHWMPLPSAEGLK